MENKKNSTPLLLTGTIDSSVYNNTGNIIQNVAERLNQYESSIEKYISSTPFDIIVFIVLASGRIDHPESHRINHF